MEPALEVLHRALAGDEGARNFLDRTSAIYVLDATDLTKPAHTYGCWNFIHQAMNEVERAETKLEPHSSVVSPLVPHAQLLATMALKVARRSNSHDKHLVQTCIENASKYNGTSKEEDVVRLRDINSEIRDIVMGRLAALAMDPTFHKATTNSALADTVVLETFCAVLAANAVSNGPLAVKHLVSEWIVPSSHHLPPFCLTCVTLHLASEAAREGAPAGITDALQQLSTVVMAGVLAPLLTQAIQDAVPAHDKTTHRGGGGSDRSLYDRNCKIAALSLKAINQWCAVTDLSLAQIKHICAKVGVNMVVTLSDAMYSDSRLVLDALADLVECVMERHQVTTVSERRMTQVRYIMQVEDEQDFRQRITAADLVQIESKEMAVILEELVSAIGLQRFRFSDRQASGDLEVCRNLVRMGASICGACRTVTAQQSPVMIGPGLLDLLLKSAAHPSVDVSGIALDALTEEVSSQTGLVHKLLPILQGRAITPHTFIDNLVPSIRLENQPESDGYHSFDLFRTTSLADCLIACFHAQPEIYMTSCVAAIDEFCQPTASPRVSFHLEAALFCVGIVAETVGHRDMSEYLVNCTGALARRGPSLDSNPLTLAQACRFISKYSTWYAATPEAMNIAADLTLSTFSLCATEFAVSPECVEMRREGNISPFAEARKALKALLMKNPRHFVSGQAIAALGAGWEASYAASNRIGILTVDDRKGLCEGICHVLACWPEAQRPKSLLALAMPALNCLETMLQHAKESKQNSALQEAVLARLASEIIMIGTIAASFSRAVTMDQGRDRVIIQEPALSIVKRALPPLLVAAKEFSSKKSISDALGEFLYCCVPGSFADEQSSNMLDELYQLTATKEEGRLLCGESTEEL